MSKLKIWAVFTRIREKYSKEITNIIWLFSDKVFHLFISVITNAIIARYLMPEGYGLIHYALSLVSIISVFVYLGLKGIITRDLITRQNEENVILGTSLGLKFLGGILGYGFVIALTLLMNTSIKENVVLFIIAVSLVLTAFEITDYWFEAKVLSKYVIIRKIIISLFILILRIIFVISKQGIILFALTYPIEFAISYMSGYFVYRKKLNHSPRWKFSTTEAIALLKQSWLLIISGFLSLINLKIDQTMLKWFSSNSEVGIYSAAVTMSEAWYAIATAIVVSFFPRIIKLKEKGELYYNKSIQRLLNILAFIPLCIAIIIQFLGETITVLVFGPLYIDTATILAIHIWGSIFVFMRQLFSSWLILERMYFYSFISHGLGAFINVVLNTILIPKFGGIGAAIATIISYSTSGYFALFIGKRTRKFAIQMTCAIFFPFICIWRLMLSIGKKEKKNENSKDF